MIACGYSFFYYFLKIYVQFSPCLFPFECLAWRRLRKEVLWWVVMSSGGGGGGGNVFPKRDFKNLLFCVLRRWPCPCRYFTIVFGISGSIPSSCRCFKACVACWNVTLRASGKTRLSHRLELNCKSWFYSKPLKLLALILFWKVHMHSKFCCQIFQRRMGFFHSRGSW